MRRVGITRGPLLGDDLQVSYMETEIEAMQRSQDLIGETLMVALHLNEVSDFYNFCMETLNFSRYTLIKLDGT